MSQAPANNNIRSFLAWVWAGVLMLGGAAVLVQNLGLLPGQGVADAALLLGAGGTALLSIPFMIRWLVYQDEWWAVVTAWVFFAIAILLGVMYAAPSRWQVAAIVALGEIAAPFAVAYFVNKQYWWTLIVAYAALVLGILAALTLFNLSMEILGAIALLAVALPFWVIYISDRTQWWALFPAGIMGAIGAVLLVLFSLTQIVSGGFYVILNVVLAGVFLALWLAVRRLDWALWIMSGFIVAAVLSIWFPSAMNWGVQALVIGLYIAFQQVRVRANQTASTAAASGQPQPATAPPPPAATPPPAQAATPSAPPPPAATPTQINPQLIDAAASERARSQQQAPTDRQPLVDFRPLDPFSDRSADEEKDDDD